MTKNTYLIFLILINLNSFSQIRLDSQDNLLKKLDIKEIQSIEFKIINGDKIKIKTSYQYFENNFLVKEKFKYQNNKHANFQKNNDRYKYTKNELLIEYKYENINDSTIKILKDFTPDQMAEQKSKILTTNGKGLKVSEKFFVQENLTTEFKHTYDKHDRIDKTITEYEDSLMIDNAYYEYLDDKNEIIIRNQNNAIFLDSIETSISIFNMNQNGFPKKNIWKIRNSELITRYFYNEIGLLIRTETFTNEMKISEFIYKYKM